MGDSNEVGPINMGNNQEISVLELAEMVLKLANSKSKIVYTSSMDDDPQQRCPDLTLAMRRLGWSPEVSLNDGLARTIEWFRSR